MKHSEYIRERKNKKGKSIQAIINYKYDSQLKWNQTSATFQNKSDAKRWITSRIVELKNNEHIYSPDSKMTIEEAIMFFLNSKKDMVETNSYLSYKSSLKHLKDYYDFRLADINKIKLQRMFSDIPSSRYLQVKNFFNFLSKMELIKKYNFDFLKPHKSIKNKNKVISEDEYMHMLEETKDKEIIAFITIAYNYGMRSGEILGLNRNSIDMENKNLVINKQWGIINANSIYGFKVLKNKSKGNREIPFSDEILEMLLSLDYNEKEDRFFHYDTSQKINAYLKRIGYEYTAHDFRHTRASLLVNQKYNLSYIAYFIGDTLDTIINNYVDVNSEIKNTENQKFLDSIKK